MNNMNNMNPMNPMNVNLNNDDHVIRHINSVNVQNVKWFRWTYVSAQKPGTDGGSGHADKNNDNTNHQTKVTPGHKSPDQYRVSFATNEHGDDGLREMHPHIGMNPFLNGNSYLNDIIVQNKMLRGENVRVGSES